MEVASLHLPIQAEAASCNPQAEATVPRPEENEEEGLSGLYLSLDDFSPLPFTRMASTLLRTRLFGEA